MACRDQCASLKITEPMPNGLRYSQGQKRCSNCEIFMFHDGIKCPCCNTKLKTKPRSTKSKRLLNEAKNN